MRREDLFSSSITFHHFFLKTKGDIENLRALFDLYQGERFKSNYDEKNFERLIDENRFSDGVGVVYLNNEPVAFCGLTNYKNWTIITRYVVVKFFRMPWASGCLFPGIIDVAKSLHRSGVALTVNEPNTMLRDTLTGEKGTRYRGWRYDCIRDHALFETANKQPPWVHVENPIMYRNTKQYLAYISFIPSTPPFEYYEEQKTAT